MSRPVRRPVLVLDTRGSKTARSPGHLLDHCNRKRASGSMDTRAGAELPGFMYCWSVIGITRCLRPTWIGTSSACIKDSITISVGSASISGYNSSLGVSSVVFNAFRGIQSAVGSKLHVSDGSFCGLRGLPGTDSGSCCPPAKDIVGPGGCRAAESGLDREASFHGVSPTYVAIGPVCRLDSRSFFPRGLLWSNSGSATSGLPVDVAVGAPTGSAGKNGIVAASAGPPGAPIPNPMKSPFQNPS